MNSSRRAFGWAAMFALAAGYFAIGIRFPLEWVDAGHIVYPSWRVSQGALPYREFREIYGPSLFFLNALLFRGFGEDLLVMRLSMLVLKAAIAALVYSVTLRVAPRSFAWIAFAATVTLWGLPFPAVTTPYASYHATLATLLGVLVVLALPGRLALACGLAGLLFGLAATFKQTTGAFALAAVGLFLLMERGPGAGAAAVTPALLAAARAVRIAVLVCVFALFAYYLSPANTALNVALLLPPLLLLLAKLALDEGRGRAGPEARVRSLRALAALAAGTAAAPLAYALYYASQGLLGELVFNLISGVPQSHDWLVPYPPDSDLWWMWCGAWGGAVASLWAWQREADASSAPRVAARVAAPVAFAVCAALLAQRGFAAGLGGQWWFWSTNDLHQLMPVAVAWGASLVLVRAVATDTEPLQWSDRQRAFALLTCYSVTSAFFLYPSADLVHGMIAFPAFAPLLAAHLHHARPLGVPHWRSAGLVYVAALTAALVVPAVHDLSEEWRRRSDEPGRFARASGIAGGDAISRDGAELVRWLDRPENRGPELFVLSGKPLLYFLSGRVSPVDRSEFGVYLIGVDFVSDEGVRRLVDEGELIRRLRERRPLVVDDRYNAAGQHFRRRLPAAARFLAQAYEPAETIGRFRILRPKAARP